MAFDPDEGQNLEKSRNVSSPRSEVWVTSLLTLVHAVAWTVPISGLLLVVPYFDKKFRDFNMKLPLLTEWVIGLSRVVGELLLLLPLPFAVLFALDAAVLFVLRSGEKTRVLSWLWFVLGLVAPLALSVIGFFAVWQTYQKLLDALQRW